MLNTIPFIYSIVASIMAYYICKGLDRIFKIVTAYLNK